MRRSFPPESKGADDGVYAYGADGVANSLAAKALASAVQAVDSTGGDEQCLGEFGSTDGVDGICEPVHT